MWTSRRCRGRSPRRCSGARAEAAVTDAKRILVALADPGARRSLALARAAEFAARGAARLTLFHSLYSPYVAGEQFTDPKELERDISAAVNRAKTQLERLARPLSNAGIDAHVRCRWDYPVHDSIVREVLRERIDLLVLESHRHRAAARLVLTNTDWQLIRLCPCPLLLVKTAAAYERPRVLVCVDPLHAHAKPAALDSALLEAGVALATMFQGRLHAAHFVAAVQPGGGAPADPLPLPIVLGERRERDAAAAFTRLTERYDLGARRTHLRRGAPVDALPELAAELSPQVVVMGAVSRSGLRRLFIGATAEHVIDRLNCDVLVVKPAGFRTPVPRRARPRPIVMPAL
jgi:universal stress protein E